MSGWIKMRMGLRDDPTVFRLAKLTKLDRLSVIGRLCVFWSWIDAHAIEGRVHDASAVDVDTVCECKGFAEALISVGWLECNDDGIYIPNHERHNGESAKERDMKNARQARWRRNVDDGPSTPPSTPPPHASTTAPPTNGSTAPSQAPPTPPSTEPSTSPSQNRLPDKIREEKRREEEKEKEKHPPPPLGGSSRVSDSSRDRGSGSVHGFPPGFERLWVAYPRKVGKDAAARAFAKRKPDAAMVDSMVAAIEAQQASEQWRKDGGQFIPHPATWLNEGRWMDEPTNGVPSDLAELFRRGAQ